MAVMLCVPTGKEDQTRVAVPLPSRGIGMPRFVVPPLNCTLPVGMREDCAVTAAWKVSDWPKLEGLLPAVRARLVSVPKGATRKTYAAIAPGMGLLWPPV